MEGASPACGHARAVGWQAHASATRAPTCVHGDVIASDNLCGSRDYQCANQGWPKSPERHLVEHPLGPHIYLKLTICFYCGRPRTIFFEKFLESQRTESVCSAILSDHPGQPGTVPVPVPVAAAALLRTILNSSTGLLATHAAITLI